MASMYAVPKHEAQFKNNGANVKIVPYGGSKGVLTALKAGDIDLGWMGSGLAKKQGDKLDCLYSTNPADDNFIGKTVAKKIPDFRIGYVVYTNSTSDSVIAKLREAVGSEGFQNYMSKSLVSGKTDVNQADVDTMLNYVDTMENTWAK
jgi:tripartite-type tricarboxylate transporter receptor subunit TctC